MGNHPLARLHMHAGDVDNMKSCGHAIRPQENTFAELVKRLSQKRAVAGSILRVGLATTFTPQKE